MSTDRGFLHPEPADTFAEAMDRLPFERLLDEVHSATGRRVERALLTPPVERTLSDFAAKCSGKATVLGGPPECPQRPFCQPGLEKTYGITFGRFASLDAGGPQSKGALTSGTATIALVFSSDASLAS